MRPLSNVDIESELSYAYLHAVAANCGAGCQVAGRASDGNGVDAVLTAWGPFPGESYRQEVDLKVQLKATTAEPHEKEGFLSYSLKGIQRYDDLRSRAVATPRILVVMFLPVDQQHWLNISADELILKKCAYWVSLNGAPESTNDTSQTVYLPKTQIFDAKNLKDIFARISRNEALNYIQS